MNNNDAYFQIKKYISDNTGIVYYHAKDKELIRQIQKRMQIAGAQDYNSYWHLLQDKAKGAWEFDQLTGVLTIGETCFFRDRAIFNGLQQIIIPQVLEKNRSSRTIRIWCAGCASGEEAYSISILLKQKFSHLLSGWDILILGTDINRDCIAQAISGGYQNPSFQQTPEPLRQSCFSPGPHTWAIKQEYKNSTSFAYHNLIKHPFPSLIHNLVAFDIILCREVIHYYDKEINQRLTRQFQWTLKEGGWFIAGHADYNAPSFCPSFSNLFSNFNAVNIAGACFYKKKREEESMDNPKHFEWQHLKASPAPGLQKLCHLTNKGQWDQALAFSQQLMAADNLNPVIYFFQGLICEHMGQRQETEKLLKKTLRLDRYLVPAHYHLGLLWQKAQNINAARQSFNNVIHLLDRYDDSHRFEIVDDLSASQLKKLAEFNLEILEKYEETR